MSLCQNMIYMAPLWQTFTLKRVMPKCSIVTNSFLTLWGGKCNFFSFIQPLNSSCTSTSVSYGAKMKTSAGVDERWHILACFVEWKVFSCVEKVRENLKSSHPSSLFKTRLIHFRTSQEIKLWFGRCEWYWLVALLPKATTRGRERKSLYYYYCRIQLAKTRKYLKCLSSSMTDKNAILSLFPSQFCVVSVYIVQVCPMKKFTVRRLWHSVLRGASIDS